MTLAIEKSAEITEASIRLLVDAFYARVRVDSTLGPIFARALTGDWEPHLQKMVAFWSSVMLTSGRYKGNPVVRHLAIPGMTPELFTHWLILFDASCRELFDDGVRAAFRGKAERIAESLKLALFYRPDRPWPPGPAS
jgi:hemoglobin